MKKCALVFLVGFTLFFAQAVFADESSSGTGSLAKEMSEGSVKIVEKQSFNPQLALSSEYYPVTPGDIYTLAFLAGNTPVTYTILVDSTYRIRVANLAQLDVRGMSFTTLKERVETIVSKNYPLSGVQFGLSNPAIFRIVVKGEVKKTAEQDAWALSRLSDIIASHVTLYSSTRKVSVTSLGGKTVHYDLFKATRFGDLSQDPFVRPGDIITVNRVDRVVTITGAVERPGSYQLLPGEGLRDLISYYGSGFTPLADSEKLEVVRYVDSSSKSGQRIYVSSSEINSFSLKNLDTVSILQTADYLPVVYIEGSVEDLLAKTSMSPDSESPLDISKAGTARITVRYNQGETWASLVQRNRTWFNAYSDTKNAYIIRNNEHILLDIDTLLYIALDSPSPTIESHDTLVVPYRKTVSSVILCGEVKETKEISGWPLKRLSQIVFENLTPYSSIRDIEITDVSGTVRVFDYFRATRFGEFEQNPWVRPGDKVSVKRLSRSVTITGAVERPGSYQLLDGEGFKELIEYYGSGLTPLADSSRIELIRYIGSDFQAGQKIFLSSSDIDSNFELNNFDSLYISQISDLIPVMFIEGAIGSSNVENAIIPDSSTRIVVRFNYGENYASLVRRYRASFSAVSDTAHAYVIRGDAHIALNLNPMLYDASYRSDYLVEENDVLIIPFRQYFVTVSGAVQKPGRYPYIPDRDWSYYVSLAGGFNTLMNSRESMSITDIYGNKHKKTEPITPETVVEANSNAFLFYFNQYAPIVTTTLSVISTLLTASMLFLN